MDKLEHLTEEQIENLMNEYYSGSSVNDLIKKYKLQVTASNLYKCFPPITMSEYECEFCGSDLVLERLSKTNVNQKRYENELYCPFCLHKPYYSKCRCEGCKEKEKELEKSQREKVIEMYSINKPKPLNYDDLSFTHKIFLGAALRELLSEDLSVINPFASANRKLVPTDKFLEYIFEELFSNKIIIIDPIHSDLNSFVLEHEEFPRIFYRYKACFELNLLMPPDKKKFIQEILKPSIYNPEHEVEASHLWRQIAVEECIEYLLYNIKEVNFDFSPGEKTYTVLDELLNSFSVAQIYGIIWKQIAEATRLYQSKQMSQKHAANSIIGGCQRYGERAIMSKWNLTEYNRIKELPQSVISEFFFNVILEIGDLGFKAPPTTP